MAGQSLQQLLAWMKDPDSNVMWGWDAIAAVARDKANTLLIQEYISRFTKGNYLPPISAGIETVADHWQEYIHHFELDTPRLSFEVESAEGAEFVKGVLTMAVMGGSQIAMEKKVDFWRATKMSWINPLQGPKLYLDLQLEKVPGVVKDDGRVYLDLHLSDNFRLTFGSTPTEQRLGGEFFQELFSTLPDEQRVFPLGVIKEGGEPLMRPQTFKLGAQSGAQVADDGLKDGAVMIYIQMEGGSQGGTPGVDYPFLIPADEGHDYSATVLFDRDRVLRSVPVVEAVMPALVEMLGSSDFDYVLDAAGVITKATSKSSGMSTEPYSQMLGPYHFPDRLTITLHSNGLVLSAAQPTPLTVTRNADQTVSVGWVSQGIERTRCDVVGDGWADWVWLQWQYTLTVNARYGLADDDHGGLVIKPLEFNYQLDHSQIYPRTENGKETPAIYIEWENVHTAVGDWLKNEMLRLEPPVKDALTKVARVVVPIDRFMEQSIELNFGQSITDTLHYAPRDIGAFGRVNPLTTAFAISPLEPRIHTQTTQQFSTEPGTRVSWSVEHLLRGNDDPGSISADGLYTAPVQVAGNYLRVRVTATAESGFKSSALVTVVPGRLTVNPLIQLCDPGSSVTLQGGALEGGALTWTLVNPGPDSGSLAPQGNDCTYTAKVASTDDAFVLDEIKVSGEGDSLSVYVLVIRAGIVLTVKPDPDAGLPQGQVKLRASVNKEVAATWSLPLGGPGDIDPKTGIYTSDPNAIQRYVLVYAEYDSELGLFMGEAILPLPLADFSEELQLLSM